MSARWKLSFGVLIALSGAAIAVYALLRTEPAANRAAQSDAAEPFSLSGGWRAYQWPGTHSQPPQSAATLEAARGLAQRMSSPGGEHHAPPTAASAPAVAGYVAETPARSRPAPETVPPAAHARGASDRSGSSTAVITTLPVVELRPLRSAARPERTGAVGVSADSASPLSDDARAPKSEATRQAQPGSELAHVAGPPVAATAAADATPRKARPVVRGDDDRPAFTYGTRARRPLVRRRAFVDRELGPLEILRLRAP